MFWISQLLKKAVVSLSDANNLGEICGFAFCQQQNCLAVETSQGYKKLSSLFVLSDALTVSEYFDVTDTCLPILGSEIFSTQGKYLSTVEDILVDKDFNLKKILTADGLTIVRSKIYLIGQTVLLKSALPKKPKDKKPQAKKSVSVESNLEKHELPPRHYGDFSFLLGRVCKKTITNFQGEVMVRSESLISKEVLRQAKISGKLIELALNC